MAPGASTPRGTTPSTADENRLETARLDAHAPQVAGPDVESRRIARRLLRSGQPDKAVSELIRFSRERPMTARMAAALVALGLVTKKTGPIQTIVTQGTDEAEGRERVGVLRALARLLRRSGQEEAAVETLAALLAEAPEDRRSRLVLNALLEQFERWEALDASLDKEARLLLRRRYFRAASRVTLRRARLWGERLGEHARAALRFSQAAQYAEQGQDPHSAFLVRLLWLRALVHADAPTRSIDEGIDVVLDAAERVGREARARAFIRELGLTLPSRVPLEPVAPEPSATVRELPVVVTSSPSSTLADQEAVEAEPAPTGQAGEALLVAAASSPSAPVTALVKLEARYVARGAWRELARFYRETAATRADSAERASWLEKLAELLESELDDAAGAAKVWEEVAQLTGDAAAVSEQVRILDEQKDEAGVRQALDSSVVRTQDPIEKARLLVLRANEALGRGDADTATRDFEEALRVSPASLDAAAGLAELGLRKRDVGPLRALERLLTSAPKNLAERPALFRRLARVADAFKDARVAALGWSEVLASAPADDEALARLWVLAKGHRDDAQLERVLRAVLAKDPRGESARAAWMDLVTLLERRARFDDAIASLKEAVKVEPGHLEAWLSLVDRLLARRLDDEATWALEHAATSAPEGPQRVSLWRRLARHARERLGDEDRAEKYEDRIERAKAEPPRPAASSAPAPAPLPGGPLTVPAPRASRPKPPVVVEPATTVTDEEESEAFARALGASLEDEDERVAEPLALPPRLQRLIIPVIEDFSQKAAAPAAPPPVTSADETREAPADEFADDDDVDEVSSEEATIDAGRAAARGVSAADSGASEREVSGRRAALPRPGATSDAGGHRSALLQSGDAVAGGRRAPLPRPGDSAEVSGRREALPRPGDAAESSGRGRALRGGDEPSGRHAPLPRPGDAAEASGRGRALQTGDEPSGRHAPLPRPRDAAGDEPSGRHAALPRPRDASESSGRALREGDERHSPIPRPGDAAESSGRGRALQKGDEPSGRHGPLPRPGDAAESSGRGRALRGGDEPSGRHAPLARAGDVAESSGRALREGDERHSSVPRPGDAAESSGRGRALRGGDEPSGRHAALPRPGDAAESSGRGRAVQKGDEPSGRHGPLPRPGDAAESSGRGRALQKGDEPSGRHAPLPRPGDSSESSGSGRALRDEAEPRRALEHPASRPPVSASSVEVDEADDDETPAPRPSEPPIAPPIPSRPKRRRTQDLADPPRLGDPVAPIPPSGPSPSKQLTDERRALFERVRANPLDPDGYRMLAEHFDTANDANRSTLMLELARALEGDPNAAPRTPKLILSATDRAGLRHPLIRTEGGELVTLASPALCRLFPAKGKDALTTEEFTLESGKGAKPAADALLASVRLLGMRAPDVYLSDEAGPPFSVLQTTPPRLIVNRLAVKKPVAEAELRFYAGRALFTLSAELLALRTLKREHLKAGLEAVGQMLKGQTSTEAKLLRAALPAKTFERLKTLWPKAARSVDLSALMEGARHSVNRAGLVVCGSIAPAIASLRAKKALPVEVTELVRFAASERYLQLRNRKLGKK